MTVNLNKFPSQERFGGLSSYKFEAMGEEGQEVTVNLEDMSDELLKALSQTSKSQVQAEALITNVLTERGLSAAELPNLREQIVKDAENLLKRLPDSQEQDTNKPDPLAKLPE